MEPACPTTNAEQHPGAYLVLDAEGRCTFFSSAMAELLDGPAETLLGEAPWSHLPAMAGNSLRHSLQVAIERQEVITLETGWRSGGHWIESRIHPDRGSACITFLDVTKRRRSERLNEGHREVLTGIAAQHPVSENLELIALLHEELHEGALCSVLLLDSSGELMQIGAAPSLPESYNRVIENTAIGEGQGSCGTAIWSGKRVVVADVATHPYWTEFREVALSHDLKACWSTPIFGSSGQCLGSFAVYYKEVREPSDFELNCIDQMLTVTAIAIESANLIEQVRERDGFFELSLEVYCVYDNRSGRTLQANPTFTRLTGFSESDLRAMSLVDM
ncbi:GAF domain-containing protein, partial [Dokdonella sp.]|uniref:GAF domain-containing protein n=1 Tax=Dokdonella sp. TaxID=2291710 RepID=UPI003C4E263F